MRVRLAHRSVKDKVIHLTALDTLNMAVLDPQDIWDSLPEEVRGRLRADDYRVVLATIFALFLETRIRETNSEVKLYEALLADAALGEPR